MQARHLGRLAPTTLRAGRFRTVGVKRPRCGCRQLPFQMMNLMVALAWPVGIINRRC